MFVFLVFLRFLQQHAYRDIENFHAKYWCFNSKCMDLFKPIRIVSVVFKVAARDQIMLLENWNANMFEHG